MIYHLGIPIFGVLTMADTVDFTESSVIDREVQFQDCLGLTGSTHRYTRMVNYCDNVDTNKERMETYLPHLDVPILKFLIQVRTMLLNMETSFVYIFHYTMHLLIGVLCYYLTPGIC